MNSRKMRLETAFYFSTTQSHYLFSPFGAEQASAISKDSF